VNILGGTASFFANVDPTFAIDPTFADAAEHSVVLSAGAGNSLTSAVPEPSTWSMVILGFCGLGFLALRKKSALRLA
jgi:hypothetical protein